MLMWYARPVTFTTDVTVKDLFSKQPIAGIHIESQIIKPTRNIQYTSDLQTTDALGQASFLSSQPFSISEISDPPPQYGTADIFISSIRYFDDRTGDKYDLLQEETDGRHQSITIFLTPTAKVTVENSGQAGFILNNDPKFQNWMKEDPQKTQNLFREGNIYWSMTLGTDDSARTVLIDMIDGSLIYREPPSI